MIEFPEVALISLISGTMGGLTTFLVLRKQYYFLPKTDLKERRS